MTTLVVLAAGRGSRLGRIGDELPKCLLPLDGRAALSHQLEQVPPGTRLVVVTGYRADQVEEYVRLAHPTLDVTIVREERWGRGPGASLLEARDVVGDDDLVFVACDTLWERDDTLWDDDASSWMAVAPIPAGTPAARWCRVVPNATGHFVLRIDDKTPEVTPGSLCWTAFARVARDVLPRFWDALADADARAGEIQFSSGLDAVVSRGEPVEVRHIQWLDVGDEQAYRAALVARSGYDPLKPDQVTYVLPRERRVVKWHVDPDKVRARVERAKLLDHVAPRAVEPVGSTMMAYEFVDGRTLYDPTTSMGRHGLLDWWEGNFWHTRREPVDRPPGWRELTTRFYRDKTFSRVMSLDATLRPIALDAVTRVDWDELIEGCVPGVFHGDLTFANVIMTSTDEGYEFTAIDWREDFAGETAWGDLRYDMAKLLSGTVFHWENAAHGDFRRWDEGPRLRRSIEHAVVNRFGLDLDDVRRLAALCLIGSSALHAAPMDEILVTRGARWLGELTR